MTTVAELVGALGWDVDFETMARYQSALNQAHDRTAALEDETRQLTKAIADMEKIRSASGQIDTGKAMGVVSLGAPPTPGAPGLTKGKREAIGLGRALEYAHAALGTLTKGYAIAAGVLGRVSGLFSSSAAAAATFNDAATRLGLGVETVQELGFAADQSGSNLETLAGGLKAFADKADAAGKGGREAARALRQVGINAADIKGGKLPLDEALASIADRFAAMPDGARKSALAVDLFGGAGVKLIPLLNKGSKGIAELRAEAQRLGVVMSADAAASLATMGDEQAKLRAQLAGLRNQAVAALVPVVLKVVRGLQEWIAANRQILAAGLAAAVGALGVAFQIVGGAIAVVVEVLAWFGRHTDTAIALVTWLGAALVAFGIKAAAAWVMALGPIGWVIAGVAALIVAWPYLRKAAVAAATAISSAFRRLWSGMKSAARSAYDAIAGIFSKIGGFFAAIGRGIRDAFTAVVNWIIGKLNTLIDALNWTIRQMNRVPGVDIGQVDRIDTIGEARVPMIPDKTAAANRTVNQSTSLTVNVDAGGDPQQVAAAVRAAAADVFTMQLVQAEEAIG